MLVPIVLATILFLAGCVTSGTGGHEVRIGEAVQNRIAAGMEYLQMGKPNEARQHFSRALELEPRSPQAHNAMALMYRYEGDSEREEFHYRRALRADRNFSVARNNYGILLHQRGDYRQALRQFERAANDPGYNSRGLAFENMARSHMALGQRDEGIAAYNRALRLNPNASSILLDLGNIHLEDGDVRMARRYLDQYYRVIERPRAAAVWLDIRLAAAEGDTNRQMELERQLTEDFPNAAETRAWRSWRDDMARGTAG
ncbi:type IV pilus biogenesis/stability protein PilW [Isoalcanivorax indicus]|uniref:type IV pilus biogenesis/stability protein PilW n=1 Tax=Isoalcanivorax indicus TaxID=2202653 RepID=UPI001FEC1C31|nr:type IV pilus biogenesis/stability protein PilW [Isoalcanivorax indicus]